MFTKTLAHQVRRQEKIRFIQLIIGFSLIAILILTLLIRIQHKDEALRQELQNQCQARNRVYELNRSAFHRVAKQSTDPREQDAWNDLLEHYPPVLDCQLYIKR